VKSNKRGSPTKVLESRLGQFTEHFKFLGFAAYISYKKAAASYQEIVYGIMTTFS